MDTNNTTITFQNQIKRQFIRFWSSPRSVFWLGMLVAFIATLAEVMRGRNANYIVYADATRMFWEGISPYTYSFVEEHGRFFLYPPVFNVLYSPILLLPRWLGPFIWNLCNYTLFWFSIKTLPERFDAYKHRTFLFLLPILLQAIFCYQYNIVVCYLFLFAFTLMEKGKGHWAAILIMVSATTKIYGGIQLAMLLMYNKPWRNICIAIISGAILLTLPAINTAFEQPLSLYDKMADMLNSHNSGTEYVGILYAKGLKSLLRPNHYWVQGITLLMLAVCFFARYKRWGSPMFRTGCLAVLMGFIILFSDCPETHTYLIAITGYLLVFYTQNQRKWYDWLLFWLLFVNFAILPTDVLCPPKVHKFIHNTFWLDVYTFTFCWFRTVWLTFKER